MTALDEATTFPGEHASYDLLSAILGSEVTVTLASQDVGQAELPAEVRRAFAQAVEILRRGEAVAVSSRRRLLTTQEAADLLGVSRPTLIKYLDQKKIPFEMRGRHRRLDLKDVLDFQEDTRRNRAAVLDGLTADSEDYRSGRDDEFVRTR